MTSAGWHTNFQLSRGGEYVGLFGPDGQVVDAVTFGEQEVDVSLGRLDGSDRVGGLPNPDPRGSEYDPSTGGTGRATSDSHAGQWTLRRPR